MEDKPVFLVFCFCLFLLFCLGVSVFLGGFDPGLCFFCLGFCFSFILVSVGAFFVRPKATNPNTSTIRVSHSSSPAEEPVDAISSFFGAQVEAGKKTKTGRRTPPPTPPRVVVGALRAWVFAHWFSVQQEGYKQEWNKNSWPSGLENLSIHQTLKVSSGTKVTFPPGAGWGFLWF